MRIIRPLILWCIGGLAYLVTEFAWRGYSHWSMFIVGGICFVAVGMINEVFPWNMLFQLQCIIGAILITVIEYIAGYILNLWLHMAVWDYSSMPFNVSGQVCLIFSILWCGISAAAILLDDYIRYRLFHEEKPRYRFGLRS